MKVRHATQVLSLAAVLVACGENERVAGCPSTRPESVGEAVWTGPNADGPLRIDGSSVDAGASRVSFVIDVVDCTRRECVDV